MKNDGHFATLIISIPYINNYTNEELMLYFDQQQIEWKPEYNDNTNIEKCEWIAFYADVHHEIKPISDGNRITVTCNLFIPDDAKKNKKKKKRFVYSPYINKIVKDIDENSSSVSLPKPEIWEILNYCGDHMLLKQIENILSAKHGRRYKVSVLYIASLWRKKIKPWMLKGRDLLLYKWLKQYFEIIITPILIRNTISPYEDIGEYPENQPFECDKYNQWLIMFGDHIKKKEKVIYMTVIVLKLITNLMCM